MLTPEKCLARYGVPDAVFEKKWMTFYNVSPAIRNVIHALPGRIYCNADLVAPLDMAITNLIDAGIGEELKTWDGCFNIRLQRGFVGTVQDAINAGKVHVVSIHSWGCAVDVNAAWNRLDQKPTLSPGFVSCFKKAGFDWGGDWDRLDGMHFQLADTW